MPLYVLEICKLSTDITAESARSQSLKMDEM